MSLSFAIGVCRCSKMCIWIKLTGTQCERKFESNLFVSIGFFLCVCVFVDDAVIMVRKYFAIVTVLVVFLKWISNRPSMLSSSFVFCHGTVQYIFANKSTFTTRSSAIKRVCFVYWLLRFDFFFFFSSTHAEWWTKRHPARAWSKW